jgi:hypothetical protein
MQNGDAFLTNSEATEEGMIRTEVLGCLAALLIGHSVQA